MTTEGLQTVKFLNDVYGSKSVREMFGHDGILNIYLPNLAVDAQPIWELTTKEWRFKEHNPVSDPVLEISGGGGGGGGPLQIFRQISCPVEEATSKDDVEIEDFCRRLWI